MMSCETCQTQLLHHLYGLLDDADRQAVDGHIASCSTCQAALAAARQQQELLAVAAKGEFPHVRFSPVPQPAPLAPTIAFPRTKRSQSSWLRWAVAACVLALLGGAATFAGIGWQRYSDVSRARDDLARAEREKEDLRQKKEAEAQSIAKELRAIEEQIKQLESQFRSDLGSVQRDFENQQVRFSISHPKTLQAGGTNKLTIKAEPKAGPAGKHNYFLIAQVVNDKTRATISQTSLKDGVNDFTLPANLPLADGDQLTLRVLAVDGRAPLAVAGAISGCISPNGNNPLAVPATVLLARAEQTLLQESLPLVTSIYVTHLMTDRPLYRPGETVYFRSLTLERFSLKPPVQDFDLHFKLVRMVGGKEQVVDVLDPDTGKPAQLTGTAKLRTKAGTSVLGPDGNPIRGIGAGAAQLPDDLPGGEYTLIVSEAQDRFPAEKRKIIVNRYQAPRLYKDVDFTRKSYGPTDVVTALCKVAAVEGGKVLANQPVTAVAEVDGVPCKVLSPLPLQTDERGECVVQFRLPANMKTGEGILAVTFTDGANVETTVEPIPIVLKKLKVEFFPEGGELVGGVPNRVYFQVRTMVNKPAELRGRIVDAQGNEVAAIATFNDGTALGVNQGMGRFDFTPQAGKSYELRIDTPHGIEGRFLLPPAQNDGVVLHLPSGVVTQQIDVVLTSAKKDRKLLVGAYCRGKLLDHHTVLAEAGKPVPLALKPASGVGGVYRVTVFEIDDDKLTPLAERLLYRRSPEKLNIQLFTDKKQYTPGDKVTLSLQATNEHRQPAPAIVVVSVVDKSILKLRNDRAARSMPAHFLLTSEVRGPEDLEYADFLLLEHPRTTLGFEVAKATVALDLLLGTQGWRRFIEQQLPEKIVEVQKFFKDDAQRLAVVSGQSREQVPADVFVSKKVSRVIGTVVTQHEALEKKLSDKEVEDDKLRSASQVAMTSADASVTWKQHVYTDAERRAKQYRDGVIPFMVWLLVVVVVLASVVLIAVGLAYSNQGRKNGPACLTLGVVVFACLLFGGLGLLVMRLAESGPRTTFYRDRKAADQVQVLGGARMPNAAPQETAKAAQLDMFDRGTAMKAEFGVKIEKGMKKEMTKDKDNKFDGPPPKHKDVAEPKADMAKLDDIQRNNVIGFKKKGMAPAPDPFLPALPGNGEPKFFGNLEGQQVAGLFDQGKVGGFRGGEFFNADRELRKQGKFTEVTQQRLLTMQQQAQVPLAVKMLAKIEPLLLREYAHHHAPNTDGVRRDFTEMVFWHPVLVLPGHKATDVSFDLSDAVTRFEVQVWGHTLDGRLGAVTTDITSKLPFNIDAKLPIEISNTDQVAIPVALTNDTDKNRNVTLKVEAEKLKLIGKAEQTFALHANSRDRKVLHFQPDTLDGTATVRLFAQTEPFFVDAVERTFKIVPEGFPVVGKRSDLLEGVCEQTIQLPAKRQQWVPGTLKLQVQVFPSTLADLQKGLEALLREPCGCFEQTSSSNYPNVMILDYLKESDQVQPQVEKKALALMNKGYGQLVSFECIDPNTRAKKEGYEWFGQTAPPHEALTAYGLLQFTDMAKYQPVDQAMVERTKKYLLSQRDGKGGFKRNQRALDSFGRAPNHITDAYIVWALLESGVKEDLSVELNALLARIEADAQRKNLDAYFISLVSLSMHQAGRKDTALDLLKKLRTLQKNDGQLIGATTSITHSGGSQLAIETTSLAVLAWLRVNQPQEFNDSINKAVKWIGQQRGGYGGYGSTQSTILALKALIAHTRATKHTATAGKLLLFVNDKAAGVKEFAAGMTDPIILELADENLLRPEVNTIRVEITGAKNHFPHTLTWSYNALTPANSDKCPVRLATKLNTDKADEGQTVRLSAVLENASGAGQGMAVAILGLPAGLSLPTDLQEMRELVRAGKIDAFEVRGRELVIYWRELAPDAKVEVNVNLICQIPGQYRGPASRAYLYYNADERWWVDPLAININPKE